jgi:uroporphyrinogen-III synthase
VLLLFPGHRIACRASNSSVEREPTVVVTRELGKNEKLMKALSAHPVKCLEMPLIEHAEGPDRYAPGNL